MTQLSLVTAPTPPIPAGVEVFRTAEEAIARAAELGGAKLAILDPPWSEYAGEATALAPRHAIESHYCTLALEEIAAHVEASYGAVVRGGRMVVWHCFPLLCQAIREMGGARSDTWRRVLGEPVSGGAWVKTQDTPSIGHHWRSHAELAFVYSKAAKRAGVIVRSGHASDAGEHSAKPEDWTETWIRAWTDPGDIVLVPYGGLGGDVRAAVRARRRRARSRTRAAAVRRGRD